MPDIMIRCPILGKAVPTGLSTETIMVDSLDDLPIPMRSPACLKIHKWQRKDAWIDQSGDGSEHSNP
jgi:hypothetical protein